MSGTTFHPKRRNATNDSIVTCGEILPDGSIVEPVSGCDGSISPQLLLWNGSAAKIASSHERGGRKYQASDLDLSLYRALRLPHGCRKYRSDRDLFDKVRRLFSNHLRLQDWQSSVMACFVFISWVCERLSSAPVLALLGEDEEMGLASLFLLNSLCRHPILLAEISAAALYSLPLEFSPTLLIRQEELRPNLQRLLRSSGFRGLHVPRPGGRLADLSCPKAIFFGNGGPADAFCENTIPIALITSGRQPSYLDERLQEEIANEFQPRLLMYRLRNLAKIATREIDVSKFTPAVRPLARSFAQCFPGDAALAEFAARLLEPRDDEIRAEHTRDVRFAIVEILLATIHEGNERAVRVQALTAQVNTLLRSRGEILEFKPEEIGWRLKKLYITRHSNTSGQQVLLDRGTSQRVHELAGAYDLPGEQLSVTGCPDCSQSQATASA